MNKRAHRALTAALASLTGLSALLSATDPDSLGVSGSAWAWVAMALAAGTIIVTAIRQVFETD